MSDNRRVKKEAEIQSILTRIEDVSSVTVNCLLEDNIVKNAAKDVYVSDEFVPGQLMTELAMREFLRQVQDIPGVDVECRGGKSFADQTIVVSVVSLMSPEARSVARLKGDMYRKYPGASLNVDVTEGSGPVNDKTLRNQPLGHAEG